MREIKRVPIEAIMPDPDQPRKLFDEAELLALAENMKAIGQQVPIIVYCVNEPEKRSEKP
jgi:ParB family chromosome partitioning protein